MQDPIIQRPSIRSAGLRLTLASLMFLLALPSWPQARPESDEATLGELMQRESELGADRPLVAEDDVFRVLLPFPLVAAPTRQEGQIVFQLDLGSGEPASCFVHEEALDLASTVAKVSELSLPVDSEEPAILARELHGVQAFSVGPDVVMGADWLYSMDLDGTQRVGMLKVRAAGLGGDGGLICLHDQLGYGQTLDRTVERMVRSWLWPSRVPEPVVYRETYLLRADGRPLEIERVSVLVDSEGDYAYRSFASSLMPIDKNTLVAEDTYRIEYSTPTGELINVVAIASTGDELTSHLNLDATEDRSWKVSGTFQSKAFEAVLEHEGILHSDLGHRHQIAEFLASAEPGDSMVQEVWIEDVDPAAITSGTIEFIEFIEISAGVARTLVSVAGMELEMKIDLEGSPVYASAELAGSRVEIERLYVEGHVPQVIDEALEGVSEETDTAETADETIEGATGEGVDG